MKVVNLDMIDIYVGKQRIPGVPFKLREILETKRMQELLGDDLVYFIQQHMTFSTC
jgi:hypothetical protein